ncbi:hypothetical protein [uncultured Xanthomonas sp.]|uniref:hypothetical protein n=1 Tax=uncultured Xanthomonas sp. TaxID=152831 RepID=UPI0025F0B299|nr:hypothetical protein [uncultured Xanthomonas sp.]
MPDSPPDRSLAAAVDRAAMFGVQPRSGRTRRSVFERFDERALAQADLSDAACPSGAASAAMRFAENAHRG